MRPHATAWLGQTWIGRFDAPAVPATQSRTRHAGELYCFTATDIVTRFHRAGHPLAGVIRQASKPRYHRILAHDL